MNFLRNIISSIVLGFDRIGKSGLLVSFLLLLIISLFLVPLPPAILDILLVVNILVSLVLLLRALFLQSPSELYSFPTILLVTTLFRLALNVSSTRLILVGGAENAAAAGAVIEYFGNFVVQGNFGVGAIIFALIAVVNFVVIAKGSARVAEVSARFALDSLPGKQLAVDSDLRAENISRDEAELRRSEIRRESQFFGAMDGAMKFVQGDAVAGFIVTFINLIGGVGLGVSSGMEFEQALSVFGLLTIGDGLVGILPSLLISVCAGVIVTHVGNADSDSAGTQILNQISADPRVLMIAGFVLMILGVLGFPFLPFFVIGLLTFIYAAASQKSQFGQGGIGNSEILVGDITSSSNVGYLSGKNLGIERDSKTKAIDYFDIQPITLDIGAGAAISLKDYQSYYNYLRDRFYRSRGVMLPDAVINISSDIAEDYFQIYIRGKLVRERVIGEGTHFIDCCESQLRLVGLASNSSAPHPLSFYQCAWASPSSSDLNSLHVLGVEAYDTAKYLALETIGTAFETIEDIFGVADVSKLLSVSKKSDPTLYVELFDREVISLSEFSEILKRLVRENVNIRDLRRVMEGVLEYQSTVDVELSRTEWLSGLHASLRKVLFRSIIAESTSLGGELRYFSLSQQIEDEFRAAIRMWDGPRSRVYLEPEFESTVRKGAEAIFSPVLERGAVPIVIMCSEEIRAGVQEFFSSHFRGNDWLRTMAYEELDGSIDQQCVAVINA